MPYDRLAYLAALRQGLFGADSSSSATVRCEVGAQFERETKALLDGYVMNTYVFTYIELSHTMHALI